MDVVEYCEKLIGRKLMLYEKELVKRMANGEQIFYTIPRHYGYRELMAFERAMELRDILFEMKLGTNEKDL